MLSDEDASAIFVSFWSSLSSSLSSSAKVTYGMGLRAMLVRSLRRRLVDAAMILDGGNVENRNENVVDGGLG